MKLIDTKTHGYIDYLMALTLIAVPFLLNFNLESPESTVLFVLGVTLIIYSALTNYELGLVKTIPIKVHLFLDIVSGIFLAASPWLFGFDQTVYAPHLVLGLLEIGAAMATTPKPRIMIN